jgi:hypothetical protein
VEELAIVGEVFNEAGKIAKAAGLSFGYHNHDREFSRVIPGGTEMKFGRGAFAPDQKGVEIVYDGLIRNTDPSLVFFEMDVYWTVMGQQILSNTEKIFRSNTFVTYKRPQGLGGIRDDEF